MKEPFSTAVTRMLCFDSIPFLETIFPYALEKPCKTEHENEHENEAEGLPFQK